MSRLTPLGHHFSADKAAPERPRRQRYLRQRQRTTRSAVLVVLLGVALTLGLAGTGNARPSAGPPADLKAITAMDSRRSEVRQEPDKHLAASRAKVSTNVKKLTDVTTSGTPSQNFGNPADKTVLHSDKLSISKTIDGESVGNATTQQAAALNETMTAVNGSETTGDEPENGRAVIDHQYPSEGGRFVNGKADASLAFRETVAGGDALWQLGTVNQTAEGYGVVPGSYPYVGQTIELSWNGRSVTNTAASSSAALGATATATSVPNDPSQQKPDDTQQWAVVDAGRGDGSFQLVSRADGLCLNNTNGAVGVDVCSGAQTSAWSMSNLGPNTYAIANNYGQAAFLALGDDSQTLVLGNSNAFGWTVMTVAEPGGSVPTWSAPRTGGFTSGNITAPSDMAVGDLDGVVGSDGLFHDEAVVAYTDSDDRWSLRVVDYNANPSHLLVTAPDPSVSFSKNGWMQGSSWYPGSLVTKIGDFDGDGRNEILTAFQDDAGQFRLGLWRYSVDTSGNRTLQLAVNQQDCNQCDGIPLNGIGNAPTLVAGYNTSAAGDFDGDGAADLAVAYASSPKGDLDSTQLTPNVGVVTFTAALGIRSVEVSPIALASGPEDGPTYLPPASSTDPTRTGSGLRLESGLFATDPTQGFSYQRRELALSWVAMSVKKKATLTTDVYARTPNFQLYAVDDTDCPQDSSLPVCTTTSALLSAQPDPVSPFPQTPTTYDVVDRGAVPDDVPPLAMEAGAYGGNATTDPPVWGLWFLQWRPTQDPSYGSWPGTYQIATSWMVPWTSTAKPGTPVTTDSYIPNASTSAEYFTVTAYDRFGDSVFLGAPVLFDIDNSNTLEMLAAEPPKHADYLNHKMSAAALSNLYYLSTTSKSSTNWSSSVANQNTYSNGGSTVDSVTGTLAAGLGPFDAKSSAGLSESFKEAWSGSNTTSADSSGSKSMSLTSNAVDDDALWSSLHDYQVYRYPVLGNLAGGTTCGGSACYPYYEVTIPGSTTFMQQTGLGNADYNPSWQNNNALSYPTIDPHTGAVPLPDAGPYSYGPSGAQTTTTDPLYNAGTQLGQTSSSIDLTLNAETGGGSTVTSGHNWDSDTELSASASVTIGVPEVSGGTISLSSTDGFQASKTLLDTTLTSNQTTTGTEFVLNTANTPLDQGFEVGSAVYFSAAGTPKVIHGVDLTSTQFGTYFSAADTYGTNSDVALNLPGRINIESDKVDNSQQPYLSTSRDRQLVRGFQALQVDSSNPLLPTAGQPFTSNPTAGARVQFQVPVSNLSLVPMPSKTTAHFWAVPVNLLDNTVTGDKIDLGQTDVPALDPQAQTTVISPAWTTPANNDTQQYRIFVVLDENADMAEVHPLNGDVCPSTGVLDPDDNTAPLYDLMSTDPTAADPTGCGQNNQGFGLVTVNHVTASDTASPDKPAHVTLDGAGLLDGTKAHEKLDTDSSVPTVPLNSDVHGLVYAKADRHSADHQPVIVYDGDPKNGKVVYFGRMPGVSSKSGGAMPFSWKATTPGLHEFHTVLLGSRTAGQDDEQILRVWVDTKPLTRPFQVSAAADKPVVNTGGSVIISGAVTPPVSDTNDRDVALQVKNGDAWTTLGEKSTASDGTYSFSVPEPVAGTFTYRVKKFSADGRSTAYSPDVTVTVTGFVVTAKAAPTVIDLGQKTTISGTVTPTQSDPAARTVRLETKTGAGWTLVAQQQTPAFGAYSFTVQPKTLGDQAYRVVKTATATLKTAASPTVTVRVEPHVTISAKARPAEIRLGKKTTISGKLAPVPHAHKDRGVQLQVLVGTHWQKVGSTTAKASGSYRFKVKPAAAGTYSYRVVGSDSTRQRQATSTTLKVKVGKR